jgi:hypothetical protein
VRLATIGSPPIGQSAPATKKRLLFAPKIMSDLKGQLHCPIGSSLSEAGSVRKFFVRGWSILKFNFNS